MLAKKEGEQKYQLLDSIDDPANIRDFSIKDLEQLAKEVREYTIESVSKTGGHLGAGLGVVELTVALHHVFETPKDLLLWDVGHQTYPHKVLTGRKDKMHTLRQAGGLSGFAKRSESVYDVFGAGHSSTSISAALGMAVAKDFEQKEEDELTNVIAVIGDAAIGAGMAFEAMNHAGHLKKRLIVVLNDNQMSISPSVGAMHKYLSRMMSSKAYLTMRGVAKNALNQIPQTAQHLTKKAKKYAKDFVTGGNFFEEMGFHYIGLIDGHDLSQLVPTLKNIKEDKNIESPILIHVKTQKGRGFHSPDNCNGENYHAVKKFNLQTKVQEKSENPAVTYTKVFAKSLIDIAQKDEKVVGITAAMPSGTGMSVFEEAFPDRMFDVGIAEQHAVTFAAGLATQGYKPFVAIYSTFLQRAFDQIVHDIAIQKLPVRFAIDRAGLVGADGATHAGSFDIAYLAMLPNFIVMCPSDGTELHKMVQFAHSVNDAPIAFRFPRGNISTTKNSKISEKITLGKGRIIQQGKKIAILSLGTRLDEAMKAAQNLEQELKFKITIADARFAKPLDEELIIKLADEHDILLTIEEGSIGGFGSHVGQLLSSKGLLDNGLKYRSLILPDIFMDHGTPHEMYEKAGLNAAAIITKIKEIL